MVEAPAQGHGAVGASPEEGHKDGQGAGAPSLRGQAERAGLFSLEKRRLWGGAYKAFQYLKGAYRKAGEGHFRWAGRDRMRKNYFKLEECRFRLDILKKFFTVRVGDTGTGCPARLWMRPPWKHSRPGWMGL